MKKEELAKRIEHTLLKPATKQEIETLAQEALNNKFRGVCVNPNWAMVSHSILSGTSVKVVVVNDFPLGTGAGLKTTQALQAKSFADEIDTVINMDAFKNKDFRTVRSELEALARIMPTKVIIESGYWDEQQIKDLTKIVDDSGCFCIKTSTGFGPSISTNQKARHVSIMKNTVPSLLVKAAGGIKTKTDAILMINSGADIIGTSSGIKIVS